MSAFLKDLLKFYGTGERNRAGQTLEESAKRELLEETRIGGLPMEQIAAYGNYDLSAFCEKSGEASGYLRSGGANKTSGADPGRSQANGSFFYRFMKGFP